MDDRLTMIVDRPVRFRWARSVFDPNRMELVVEIKRRNGFWVNVGTIDNVDASMILGREVEVPDAPRSGWRWDGDKVVVELDADGWQLYEGCDEAASRLSTAASKVLTAWAEKLRAGAAPDAEKRWLHLESDRLLGTEAKSGSIDTEPGCVWSDLVCEVTADVAKLPAGWQHERF